MKRCRCLMAVAVAEEDLEGSLLLKFLVEAVAA